MKKFDLICRRLDGYAQAKVEERKSGAFYKVQEVDVYIARRDLEQQAKGIEDAVNKLESPDVPLAPSLILNEDLLEIASQLRKQAQELGE